MCPPSSNRQNLVVIVHVLFFSFSHGGHPKVLKESVKPSICAQLRHLHLQFHCQNVPRRVPRLEHGIAPAAECSEPGGLDPPGGCGFGQQLGKASSFIAKRTKSIAYRHDNFRFLMVNGSVNFPCFFFPGIPSTIGNGCSGRAQFHHFQCSFKRLRVAQLEKVVI